MTCVQPNYNNIHKLGRPQEYWKTNNNTPKIMGLIIASFGSLFTTVCCDNIQWFREATDHVQTLL